MSALHSEIGALAVTSAMQTSLSIHVCHSWAELEDFRPAWNRLLQLCSEPSIFQTPEWLAAWWQSFGANKNLLALIFMDADENAVGIAPL